MNITDSSAKRYAFYIIILVIGILLVYLTLRSDFTKSPQIDTKQSMRGPISSNRRGEVENPKTGDSVPEMETRPPPPQVKQPPASQESQLVLPPVASLPDAKVYNFNNGRIAIGNSRYTLSSEELGKMAPADLEILYENAVLEVTADCSTARRFGRKEDGGWDLCLVGPFTPQEPCFSFSFGVNNIWEFDDEVASIFRCQVLTFDPSMSQASHMRNDKVVFLKEGLHSEKGTMNGWEVDSYSGFLKRFGADNYIIDVLKMDIEASEWGALETAVRDGSLKNVKQLMIETHISTAGTVKDYLRYFSLLRALYDLGFRQWHHNWNTFGNYNSKLNTNQVHTCCHELYYINIKFLGGDRPVKNQENTRILAPLSNLKVTKGSGYSHIDTIRSMNLDSMPEANLEGVYFGIVEQQHINCPYSQRLGDGGDGGWDVCFSNPYNLLSSKPCIAFSFGINNVWGYDDALAEKYSCNVYMYDPSMSVNDHQRKKTSWFYRTGLSSENKVETNGWKMRTLCKLFEELGYGEKTVDLVKIDVEHWEWVAFEKAVQEGCLKRVKQLLFESHTSELVRQKSDYARLIRIWRSLFELGFRTWKWHKNPQSAFFKSPSPPFQMRACCYEHYMLNINMIDL